MTDSTRVIQGQKYYSAKDLSTILGLSLIAVARLFEKRKDKIN